MSPTIKSILFRLIKSNFVILIILISIFITFGFYKILEPAFFKITFFLIISTSVSLIIFYHIHFGEFKLKKIKLEKDNFTTYILHLFFNNMRESLELDELINITIKNICKIFDCNSCLIYLLDQNDGRYYLKGEGKKSKNKQDIIFSNKSLLCKFLENNKSIVVLDYLKERQDEKVFEFIYKYMVMLESEVLVPIFFDNVLLGFIFLSERRDQTKYNAKDIETLRIIANEISIGFKNAMSYSELKTNYMQTINAFMMTIESKDFEDKKHTENVQYWAVKIARKLNLSNRDIEIIKSIGMLHDINKLAIGGNVLSRVEKINDEEYRDIKMHPVIGQDFVSPIDFLSEVKTILTHYKNKEEGAIVDEKESNAAMIVRILKISEDFDSVLSVENLEDKEQILEIIKGLNSSEADGKIVEALVQIIEEENVDISKIKKGNEFLNV